MGYSRVLDSYYEQYGSFDGMKFIIPSGSSLKTAKDGLFGTIMNILTGYTGYLDMEILPFIGNYGCIFGPGNVAIVVNTNLYDPSQYLVDGNIEYILISDLRKEINDILLDIMNDDILKGITPKEVVEEINNIFDEEFEKILLDFTLTSFVKSAKDCAVDFAFRIARPVAEDQYDFHSIEDTPNAKIFSIDTPVWVWIIHLYDNLTSTYVGAENYDRFNIVLKFRELRGKTFITDATLHFLPYELTPDSYKALTVLLLNRYNLDIRGFDYGFLKKEKWPKFDTKITEIVSIDIINRNDDDISKWDNLYELAQDILWVLIRKSDFKMELKKIGDDLFVDENGNEYDFSLE